MATPNTWILKLVLLSILAPFCHAVEPAEEPALKYRYTNTPVRIERSKTAQPSILPSHMAYFSVEWYHREPQLPSTGALLETDAAKTLSQQQREFVTTQRDIATGSLVGVSSGSLSGIRYRRRRSQYTLYAVSREDARKMAEVYVEAFLKTNRVASKPHLDAFLGRFQAQRDKLGKRIVAMKEEAPKNEQILKDLQIQLAEAKKTCGYQSSEQAGKAMLELNSILNTESVELAGLLAEQTSIAKHRAVVEKKIASQASSPITNWEPILLNLEQKYIDLMIDLDVAKAREKTARTLRDQAQSFLDLSDRVSQVNREVSRFEPNLSQLESNLASLETLLAQPKPPMRPLQILDKQVGICPVTIKLVD